MKTLAALLLAAAIWAVGLVTFADRVERSTPARLPTKAQGVVALTGIGSNERIGAGVVLLERGLAKRMLVSGVNREVSREDIRKVSKAARRIYDCCIDLGFTAADTVGNARETAEWARAMRYDNLIVVTADYHMPRALLELRGAMPKTALAPYPVVTDELDARHWWSNSHNARRMALEYSKYLVILAREAVLSLGPKDEGRPADPEKAT